MNTDCTSDCTLPNLLKNKSATLLGGRIKILTTLNGEFSFKGWKSVPKSLAMNSDFRFLNQDGKVIPLYLPFVLNQHLLDKLGREMTISELEAALNYQLSSFAKDNGFPVRPFETWDDMSLCRKACENITSGKFVPDSKCVFVSKHPTACPPWG